MTFSIEIPLEVRSENKIRGRHWGSTHGAKKLELNAVWMSWREKFGTRKPALPAAVRLTRVSPRTLDDDNVVGGMKAIRDLVTRVLGLSNDDDPRVRWRVEQDRGKPAVRIEVISTAHPFCDCCGWVYESHQLITGDVRVCGVYGPEARA